MGLNWAEHSIEIDAPIETCFAIAADIEGTPKWVVTIPPRPKVGSSVPSGPRRASRYSGAAVIAGVAAV